MVLPPSDHDRWQTPLHNAVMLHNTVIIILKIQNLLYSINDISILK